ncbi:PREDICTED: uncharacterized protein LOC18606799 isoform X2 [Theobroma cacao]|uniref:Uncharacterized protein LOC18606799 isoform X2 n=1 Tax=Theobroma cacao TaxID=3641 RepID=A0AB32W2N9_THECC|nr:PREDICTED: uncharacterized protein LOC18606799 isoform X2 [Theobroma cacao]
MEKASFKFGFLVVLLLISSFGLLSSCREVGYATVSHAVYLALAIQMTQLRLPPASFVKVVRVPPMATAPVYLVNRALAFVLIAFAHVPSAIPGTDNNSKKERRR